MRTITERNLRSVDLNLLVVFDALMAERNVTRVAVRNGLSQPAVSKALNRLRYLFEDPLFIRRDRCMEPTPRAMELSGPIHGALTSISRTLARRSAFNPAEISAAVTIAAIDLHQTSLLPALVARLRRDAPGLHLQLKAGDRFCQHESLEAGEVDIAIGPVGKARDTLRALPLWKDRLITLAAAGNPIAKDLTLDSFAAAVHVVDAGHVHITPEGEVTSVVDAILAASGLRREISVVLPSSAGIPFVVAATDLIGTLPSRVVRDLAPMQNVLLLPTPFPAVEVSPNLLWHIRTENTPMHLWLRSVIVEIAHQS
jgi:DNA-binding transcriptional LysR family regulator